MAGLKLESNVFPDHPLRASFRSPEGRRLPMFRTPRFFPWFAVFVVSAAACFNLVQSKEPLKKDELASQKPDAFELKEEENPLNQSFPKSKTSSGELMLP